MLGIHVYMGTRILDAADIVHNTRGALAAAAELSAAIGIPLRCVDVGGGLGVAYFDNEKDLDLAATVDGVNAAVTEFRPDHPECRVIMEVGRYFAAWCGTYVARVRYVKQSRGQWFAVTDGGMNHHMAAIGVGSFVKRNFPIRSLSHPDDAATDLYTITGPLCTPEDVLGRDVALPPVAPGDLLGVERSGAYGSSASPGLFLSHGYPAEVLVLDGAAHLVRQRDTVDDLLAKQLLVTDLRKDRTMNRTDLVTAISGCLQDVLKRPLPDVNEQTRLFEDLHLDSTTILELLMAVEETVGVEFDMEALEHGRLPDPRYPRRLGRIDWYARGRGRGLTAARP